MANPKFSYPVTIAMLGANGKQQVQIPFDKQSMVEWATIDNQTDNILQVYPLHADVNSSVPLFPVGVYQTKTIQVTPQLKNGFIITWQGNSNLTIPKPLHITFTDVSLNINASNATSFQGGGGIAANVTISGDSIGLTKSGQLPANLTGGGNLKTSINEDIVGLAKSSNFPAALTATGNFKGAIVETSPGVTFPKPPTNLFAVATSVANTAQTAQINGVAGKTLYVTGITVGVRGAAAVNDGVISIKDGGVIIYNTVVGVGQRGNVVNIVFSNPLAMTLGNAGSLTVAALGAAVITELSISGFMV